MISSIAEGKSSTSSDLQKGIAAVMGGALAHLALGTLYCWGNFMSYSPSSLKFFDGGVHPGVEPDALGIIPFTLISQCVSMPLGSILTQKFGAQKTMLLGGLLAATGEYLIFAIVLAFCI